MLQTSKDALLKNWPLQMVKLDWHEQDNCWSVSLLYRMSVSFSSLMKIIDSGCSVKHPERSRVHASFSDKETDFARSSVAYQLNRLVGNSRLGHTNIIFIDPRAKINGQYYPHIMLNVSFVANSVPRLGQHVRISTRFWLVKQSSFWLSTPSFISSEMWGPNSPDLNPVDYSIWSVREQLVYQVESRTLTNFGSVSYPPGTSLGNTRLTMPSINGDDACVREKGSHFEHNL